MGFFNAPTVVGQIKAGKLKALAVTTKDRSVILPEGADHDGGRGARLRRRHLAGASRFRQTRRPPSSRASMPRSTASASWPQVKEKLLVQGFEILPPATPEAARKLIVDDQAVWLPIIKQSGATAE